MVEMLTLSSHQQAPATECIKAAELPDKITVHLTDYRDIKRRPEGQHHFDRFINVEMIDNVWKKFIKTYWSVVDWALKSVDVVGCVQVISLPEGSKWPYQIVEAVSHAGHLSGTYEYDHNVDFIQKWACDLLYYLGLILSLVATKTNMSLPSQFFPGGYIPSCTFLISTMTSGSNGRLTTDTVSNIDPHYARILREWKRKVSR